jgi:hypothetical protein
MIKNLIQKLFTKATGVKTPFKSYLTTKIKSIFCHLLGKIKSYLFIFCVVCISYTCSFITIVIAIYFFDKEVSQVMSLTEYFKDCFEIFPDIMYECLVAIYNLNNIYIDDQIKIMKRELVYGDFGWDFYNFLETKFYFECNSSKNKLIAELFIYIQSEGWGNATQTFDLFIQLISCIKEPILIIFAICLTLLVTTIRLVYYGVKISIVMAIWFIIELIFYILG